MANLLGIKMARPLPPPDVPITEPQTGRPTQVFYDYLFSRDRGSTGSGTNGGNSGAVIFYGSGLPSNSIGVNGDFYIRTSGTSIIAFYVKSGGVW
jgi:hypothetical protein